MYFSKLLSFMIHIRTFSFLTTRKEKRKANDQTKGPRILININSRQSVTIFIIKQFVLCILLLNNLPEIPFIYFILSLKKYTLCSSTHAFYRISFGVLASCNFQSRLCSVIQTRQSIPIYSDINPDISNNRCSAIEGSVYL